MWPLLNEFDDGRAELLLLAREAVWWESIEEFLLQPDAFQSLRLIVSIAEKPNDVLLLDFVVQQLDLAPNAVLDPIPQRTILRQERRVMVNDSGVLHHVAQRGAFAKLGDEINDGRTESLLLHAELVDWQPGEEGLLAPTLRRSRHWLHGMGHGRPERRGLRNSSYLWCWRWFGASPNLNGTALPNRDRLNLSPDSPVDPLGEREVLLPRIEGVQQSRPQSGFVRQQVVRWQLIEQRFLGKTPHGRNDFDPMRGGASS
mmetsp:Transcript_42991/g.118900  ORF Transcript_42991/g.118900 Transcript_42991/m.118900 type:complete len:258 (+) Transcript_42991:1165-1938(+)